MKITIFFPCFFLILTGLFGQDYKPMLTDNSEWHEYFTVFPPGNATLHIGGDSIVNGIAYKKIFADPGDGAIWSENYTRLFREDTLEKKIYRLRADGSEEFLHYDFSLLPGDTFVVREDTDQYIVLDSISEIITNSFDCGVDDTPTLDIEKPKVFYFHDASYSIIWIEGIGSLAGLLRNDNSWGGGLGSFTLLCHYNEFQERDFHYIFCEEPNPCQGYQDDVQTTNHIQNNNINIFPNPASEQITIDLTKLDKFKNIDIIIYNLNGQEKELQTHNYHNNVTLNIENFPNGIYFIKLLIDNQQIYIQKIIKQ